MNFHMVTKDRCKSTELVSWVETNHRQNNEYIEVCFNISAEREVLKAENAEFKRQIASGDLVPAEVVAEYNALLLTACVEETDCIGLKEFARKAQEK